MTRSRNVLVFSAGTEVGLEIHQTLKDCKEVLLHGVSMPVSNHALHGFERYCDFWVDIKILWLTVKNVLVRHGINAPGQAPLPAFTRPQANKPNEQTE